MSKEIKTDAIDSLFEGILSLKDKEECYKFFEDICTINGLQKKQVHRLQRSAV